MHHRRATCDRVLYPARRYSAMEPRFTWQATTQFNGPPEVAGDTVIGRSQRDPDVGSIVAPGWRVLRDGDPLVRSSR